MILKHLVIAAALIFAASCSSTDDKAKAEEKPAIPNKWVTTYSGLQYKVLLDGEGKKPTVESRVVVHYEGRLLDGTVFDSSYKREKPASFPLNRVIKGWTEGLQLMSPGAVYLFKIPPKLAYGSAGAGNLIPPDSTLIFKVELISSN